MTAPRPANDNQRPFPYGLPALPKALLAPLLALTALVRLRLLTHGI